MQNYHQNNCGCRQTTDYGRYSSTQYVSRPQATPCCDREDSLDGMPLAMAYVPWQIWQRIYEAEKGFCRGTNALAYFHEYSKLRNQALKEYAKYYGPLTIDTTMTSCTDRWNWINEPWPWQEGGC